MNEYTFFTDITLDNTKFRDKKWRLPATPAYTSLYTDAWQQTERMKDDETKVSEAVFPERLNVGKTLPPNGGLGLYMVPQRIPEVLTGAIVSSSI